MTRIILLFWILSPEGHMDRLQFEGFQDIEHCRGVADSLTAPNPQDGWSPLMLTRCVVVPK